MIIARRLTTLLYQWLGIAALSLGIVGAFLQLLPTVPFLLLAAFCFARGNPACEERLLAHPHFGPVVSQWRARGAVGRRAKTYAVAAFLLSGIVGFLFLEGRLSLLPMGVGVIGAAWIVTRPGPPRARPRSGGRNL